MQPDTAPNPVHRKIARAAGSMMVAFLLSQVLGLVRSILMAHAFGTGAEADAFNSATRVSDLIFNLVAGGALASAFIPTITGFLTKDDRKGAWQMASAIANLVVLILMALAALTAIFAPWVVRIILVPDFPPEKQALTASLLRVVLPSAVVFGASGLLMSILNAHQRYFLPALASSMYWLGMIFGIRYLSPSLGIYGPAWGVMIGSCLHLAIQLPDLARLPAKRYWPTLGLDMPAVREVARLMGPRLFGVAVLQLNLIVNTRLASGMGEGPVTALSNAFMIMTTPLIVIAQSIATAALPAFSAQVSLGHLDQMRATLVSALRSVLLLALPASVGLILLREPLVATIWQGGRFTSGSTELVAWALLWYAAGLVGHSVIEIVYRAFYALHDTRTPVLVGAAAMALNIVFSLLLSALFTRIGWAPHGGLALANSLATGLEMVAAVILMRRRLGGLEGLSLATSLAQAAGGSLLMVIAVHAWMALTGSLPDWFITLGGVVVGGGSYALVMVALRVPELSSLTGMLRRRTRRVRRPRRA